MFLILCCKFYFKKKAISKPIALNVFLNAVVMKSILFDNDTSAFASVSDVIKVYFHEMKSMFLIM